MASGLYYATDTRVKSEVVEIFAFFISVRIGPLVFRPFRRGEWGKSFSSLAARSRSSRRFPQRNRLSAPCDGLPRSGPL